MNNSRVALVPQNAWITNSTLQENVIFHRPYENRLQLFVFLLNKLILLDMMRIDIVKSWLVKFDIVVVVVF